MILFLTPYPRNTAASQRFRFEQYFKALIEHGVAFEIKPFWEEKAWSILYKKGKLLAKFYYLLKGIVRRWLLIFTCFKYQFIFIHREIYPAGIKLLIFVLAKVLRRKIIYDFDDAIWLQNYADNNKKYAFIKSYGQVSSLCKHAHKVSVGNEYLKKYALQFNSKVIVNPTTIDTSGHHNKTINYNYSQVIIGWTGTHSTLKYVERLLPMYDKLYEQYPFCLKIISDQTPSFTRPYLSFKQWDKSTEIEDLLSFTVGIMPLTDDKWAEGKCGFKALQYMSLGVPAMVSPVGVNSEIVDHHLNGWICGPVEEWEQATLQVLRKEFSPKEYGENARRKIIERYSVKSNTENFLKLFS